MGKKDIQESTTSVSVQWESDCSRTCGCAAEELITLQLSTFLAETFLSFLL